MTYYRSYLGNAGFSLTELLVVIVIIGVLVLLALPRFTSVIDKTKTTEAKLQLKHLHTLQKSFFYEHDRYSASPGEIGYEQSPLVSEGAAPGIRSRLSRQTAVPFLPGPAVSSTVIKTAPSACWRSIRADIYELYRWINDDVYAEQKNLGGGLMRPEPDAMQLLGQHAFDVAAGAA